MPVVQIRSRAPEMFMHEESVCTAEPLTPDAFGDPHFGPKQVFAAALCAGCQ